MATKTAAGTQVRQHLTLHRTTTPLGPFAVLVDGETVYAAGFTASGKELATYAGIDPERVRESDEGHSALTAVHAYFAGDLGALDRVVTVEKSTVGPFVAKARAALRDIPAGTTRTYTELAATAGNPGAIRAAGSACATNPVGLIIPCHRVVRTDGSLGGYLYGLDIKRALLAHEAAAA
ncbi:MAG TPA: MGMT family protein [Actinocrinis sp.]|nr:MGMT family protein [Actinocrinis sp.]